MTEFWPIGGKAGIWSLPPVEVTPGAGEVPDLKDQTMASPLPQSAQDLIHRIKTEMKQSVDGVGE